MFFGEHEVNASPTGPGDWHLVAKDARISPINWTQDEINPRNAVFSFCQFYVKVKHLNQDLRKNWGKKKTAFVFRFSRSLRLTYMVALKGCKTIPQNAAIFSKFQKLKNFTIGHARGAIVGRNFYQARKEGEK